MGRLNRRALLMCLQQLGSASRADLAKALKLSQPTSGRIVDELIRQGLIEETVMEPDAANGMRRHSRAGRPGRVLRLDRTRPRFLAIHLDVHETQFAALPLHPRAADEWDLTLRTPATSSAWLKQLKEAAAQLPAHRFLGVVISVPGMVDERTGKVLFSPNLHWTEGASLADLIGEVWEAPPVFIQELRALALGHLSVADSGDDFLAVDVGEGVGAAAVVSGELYRNQLPLSGELGHTPVKGNSRMCGCGAAGCLETLLSQRGLIQSFAAAHPNELHAWESLLATLQSGPVPPWLGETLDAAGTVIAGALNILGLRKVVLTGVLGELPEAARQQLETAIARGTIWQRFGHIKVEFAPRHRTAGMVAVGIDRCVVPADPPVRVRRSSSTTARSPA